ncbi:MAG: hypothetical protein LIP08_03035 [Bacteroides sp.]|nr:hypothetical protein [Bacteroides sp.]
MEITQELVQELARQVKILLANEAQGVGEITVVPSLDGINSLPALKMVGDDEYVVEAPLSLLKVHLRATDNEIQWRLGDEADWVTLTTFPDITDIPEFRTNSEGIQWKYAKEDDTAWRELISIELLKLKFTDLTAEQIDQLKLHFSDLTEEDITLLQQPALEAAQETREQHARLEEAESIRQQNEDLRKHSESEREEVEHARNHAESNRDAAEEERTINEEARKVNKAIRRESEEQRITSEQLRNKAETARQENEKVRQTNTAEAIQNVEAATDRLNDLSDNREYIGEDGF